MFAWLRLCATGSMKITVYEERTRRRRNSQERHRRAGHREARQAAEAGQPSPAAVMPTSLRAAVEMKRPRMKMNQRDDHRCRRRSTLMSRIMLISRPADCRGIMNIQAGTIWKAMLRLETLIAG